MYARYFAHEGVGVTTAIDGQEGLDVARRYPPDAIVLDLAMPGMGGWDFLEQARQDPALADIPIVVLSAYGQTETAQQTRAAGAAAFLQKPCIPQALLGEVRRVVASRRLRRR